MSPSDPPDGPLAETVLVPVPLEPTVIEFTVPVNGATTPAGAVIAPLTFIASVT